MSAAGGPKSKKRLDVRLVELGLAPSRERAQSLILSGNVLLNDVPATKSGQPVTEDSQIRVRGQDHPYVSRGGVKLAAALDQFGINVKDRIGLDIGASTGGFTDVLLTRGATQVYAVDVGHGQLDWKIRSDRRVVVMEKLNARYLTFDQIGRKVDVIVMDVSFISLTKVLPALVQFSHNQTDWISLIKPQFEVGREAVGPGGIVESEDARQRAIAEVTHVSESLGLERLALIESPITGTDGNKEFLAHWKQRARGLAESSS